MRITLTTLFAVITTSLLCQDTTLETDKHVIVLKNQNHFHFSNEMGMQSQMAVSQTAHLENTTTNINNLLSQAKDTANQYSSGVYAWITNNKKKTVLYCFLAGYGYVLYKMLRLQYALSGSNRWATWQRTLSLEQMLTQPQQEVATNLLTTIQRKYTTTEQLDDFIGPLVAFVHDVDKELEQLHQLVTLHKWISRLHISFLFPGQRSLLEHAQEDIHRLTYLKNILLNWVSENKVSRLRQTSSPPATTL